MSQVYLGRPEFVPGTPPGPPTAKFLYVIFLYRLLSLHSLLWVKVSMLKQPYLRQSWTGNPKKLGKNYKKITKFPSPVRPPKMGKIGSKKGKNYSENTNFVIFR